MNKKIEITFYVVPKKPQNKEQFTPPPAAFHICKVSEKRFLDSKFEPFVNVDFKNDDLYIVYTDSLRYSTLREELVKFIETEVGITIEQIKGKSRKERIVYARQLYHFGVRNLLGEGLENIGKETNNDHASVLWSLSRIANDYTNKGHWRHTITSKFCRDFGINIAENINVGDCYVNGFSKDKVYVQQITGTTVYYNKGDKVFNKPLDTFAKTYTRV